jgi:alkanesulfonate monooxygenase SsuD/methylene tetrahydromethanopterin reductase-like flavin-dependent oxidoreductase (luciferase family)
MESGRSEQMSGRDVKFGLTLPNRGVIIGATTLQEMLDLAERADDEPAWDSVWVGDSILAKPRLDAIALLGALAVRTERVKLGPACFASTPLRSALLLAYQWASLDFMSGGRTIFVACQGQPASGGNFAEEFAAFGVDTSSRMKRMEEAVEIMRLLTSEEDASYEGEYNSFENVTVLPRPIQQPVPIWLVANPDPAKKRNVETALRRVARYADGWQTTWNTPESFAQHLSIIKGYAAEEGRELGDEFEACLYYNINVNEDREAAFEESKRFLDAYYFVDYDRELLNKWVAHGSPQECIEQIQEFVDAGATTVTLRMAAYDQKRQFGRVTREVLPAFAPTLA